MTTYIVREAPLPTEPYSVIRVTWEHTDGSTSDVCLDESGAWCHIQSTNEWTPEGLRDCITSFKILAEPPAVTAKAVLELVRRYYPFARIARKFGVPSA